MPALRAALTGLCVALSAVGCANPSSHECTNNANCKLGAYCSNGNCRTDCRGDFDCAGKYCDTNLGKCVNEPPPDGGARDLAGPRDLTGAPPDDLGTPDDLATPGDLAKGLGPYGDVCQMNPECVTNICSVNPFQPADRECTGDCKQGCMLGDFCAGGLTCAQSDIGKSCVINNGGQDCRGGACLGGNGAPPFCTRVCQSAADCPGGYTCSAVQNTRICINVDATPKCFGNNDCWYGTFCDIQHTRCLGECRNNADCPLWNICSGGLCQPKLATGRGGIDSPCAGANDCRTGACLLNRCLGGCAVTSAQGQWCPGGWGCNPVDDGGGGFTLGCLAAGAGSLGAACVDNSGCASGVCVDQPGYCTRYCNSAPCPTNLPKCVPLGVTADGVALKVCSK